MTEDITDKEYLDDPIRLFDSEHSRVYNTEIMGNLEDVKETIELYDSDKECTNTEFSNHESQFILPAKFFDIDRNIELLSQCCPLSIRLTDCKKYFKNNKEKVNLKEFENINGTSEEVIYVDEVSYDKNVNKNNENKKNNRSKIENTLFKDCAVKQVSCTLRNNFTNDESSNEDKFKDSKRYVDRLDKYTRTVAKVYHTLKTLVGVPTNASNIDENYCSNKINLNAKNDTHFKPDIHTVEDTAFQGNLYKRTAKSKFENMMINFKQSTNQLKSSNEKNTKTVTRKRIKRKITNDNGRILKNKRKEARGSHLPILPCPFKLMDSVKEMPIDTVNCKKINDKRIIPHCHMADLNEYQRVKTSNNFIPTNNIKYAKSVINNTPSLPVNICRDSKNMSTNKNISTFNNLSLNNFLMPCCLNHAILQDMICEVRINNEKNTKRKEKKTTAEEYTTPKKRVCDASINRIPEEIPSQFSTSLRPQWLNEIDSYIQPCPIQNLSSPAVENELPKANYEYINLPPKIKENNKPQQFLRPVVNAYQTQNANDMSKAFRNFNSYGTKIRTNTPKTSIITQKNKEPNTNDVIYIHDQKLEAIQKASKKGNKSQILDKNPILLQGLQKPPAEMTISNITIGNKKQTDNLSNKGYSPAILPIPTFQNTFNNIIKLQVNYKKCIMEGSVLESI